MFQYGSIANTSTTTISSFLVSQAHANTSTTTMGVLMYSHVHPVSVSEPNIWL